ncbi:Multidrug efflux system outer membrane protein OS=Castellaniella defragrans OX=75697 GN=HNR28_001628 PE=3 SV=1 [Castellaniella denitrificans]
MQLALDNNRDLRVAALNVEKARAQYSIQRAELIPQVGVNADGSAGRTPASVSSTGVGGVGHAYYLDVGISAYELDLFGRLRSLKAEALQSYLATEETRRAAHISLISQVASNYLSLAADLDLQKLAHETLRSRQEAYDLQTDLADAGNASQLELRQAESELENARAEALTTDNQVAANRNALELLVGVPLAADLLPGSGALVGMLGVREIPAGLPSDLLHNRPDILAAEHTLVGANADIGAARAAFFPSISLTGGLGRASDQLSSLFDHGGRYWTFAPQISLPIFSGGRLKAQLEVSKVERDIAVAQYEQAIQTAFREVADALAQRGVVDKQLAAQRKRAEAAQAAYDLVQARYDEGVASYLEVLDAQRTLYTAQQAHIQAELSQQTSLVTLYKTLGGGWNGRTQVLAELGGATRDMSRQTQ